VSNLTKKEREAIILIAAKKLNKHRELIASPTALQQAVDFFETRSQSENRAATLANIALLGVMSVYIPGAVQPNIRFNWGNLTAAPDLSPFNGGSGGVSTLDEVNRTDYKFGDNLGVQGQVIANYLNAGEFDADFIEYLETNGFNLTSSLPCKPSSSHNAP
jgi:hypothetical protein